MAQFDPFLKEHIKAHGSKGSGHVFYFSKTIYEELIQPIGQKVFEHVIQEITQSKYFSIVIDSTPDYAHIDQLSVVSCYFHAGEVYECFVTFVPITSHKAKSLFATVNKFITANDLQRMTVEVNHTTMLVIWPESMKVFRPK